MKRFTLLTMLVTLLSMTAFAQFKGIDRRSLPANNVKRAAGDLVTPPATATVETWYTAGGKFFCYGRYGFEDLTVNMPTVDVAVDGNDLYVKGLSYYFKDGWIKGSISGTTATFAVNQIVGVDEYATNYICGSNDGESYSESIVFNYNATDGILEAVTPLIIETSDVVSFSAYDYWQQPVFTREKPKGPEVVVAPEGLVADEWAISAMTNFGNPVNGYLYIGFDGNDVYLKGLCTYLPEAWIKGTLDGNTITFPGDQYFGFYDESAYTHYNFFLCSQGVVFTYDAKAGKLTAEGETFIYTGGSNLKGDVYNNPVVMKVTEKAAKPANPFIEQVYDTDLCPVVTFNVSTVDVDGNGMASSKLTFKFLKDIEEEISDVVFNADDYIYLKESLTQLPYGINDGLGNEGEFNPKYIHLKQKDFNRWNKLGIQSIYTGGGEENKSDIIWLDIKPYEKTSFDFNAMEVVCSSSESNDGDITEDRVFVANKVKLTVSPNPEGTPNRFWSTKNGPQLRVYGGTMTFEAPVGKVITKLVFNNGKWNDGNSADSGAFEGNVWTGEAKKVVVTIAGNTQLNSIDVFPTDCVPTAVEVPVGMPTETYIFNARSEKPYYDPAELTLWVKAGFAGDDVFIQGLAADANTSATDLWVKATKNEAGKYVIPANQFMGSVSFWMSSVDLFFTAVDADGNMVDAVFDFDAEKSQFTTAQTLVINGSLTELNPQQTFTNVVITKFNEVAATPADPTINNVDFSEWSHGFNCTIPTVGTNAETLNPGKFFYTVWVEKNGQQAPYTFKTGMYYGLEEDATEMPFSFNYSSWDGSHSIYFYDDASEFETWTKVGIQSIYYGAGECKKSNIVWGALTTGISNIQSDVKANKAVIYNLAGQRLDAPQKGLNIINGRKVVIK